MIACRLLVIARYMKGRAMVKKQPIRIHGVPRIGSGPAANSCIRPTEDTTGGMANGSRISTFIRPSSLGKW
ncbi:hypothetical protein FQZ97_932060 [compost metagenome]